MKAWICRHPELAGLLFGLSDAVFRALAAIAFAPADGRIYGPLLVANVHHPNGIKAFGLTTMQWFGIAAVILAAFYAAVRLCRIGCPRDYEGFRIARGLLAVVAGVLLLNVLESAFTGKVTDFVGLVDGSRFHAFNFGDIAVTVALLGFIPAMLFGIFQIVRDAPYVSRE